jgi:tetratricopeptide (TPR) repeat protein
MDLETPTIPAPTPDSTLAEHFRTADRLHREGNLADAAEELKCALKIRPNSPEAHYNLANVVRDAGELALAAEGFKMAIACAKAKRHVYPDALINLADVLNRMGRHDQALGHLREARRLQPGRIEPKLGIAAALESQGKLSAAIDILEGAAGSTSDARLFTHLGTVRHWHGRFTEAIEAFDRALHLAPKSPQAHLERARTLLMMGRLEEGFAEAEWRWQMPDAQAMRPAFTTAQWDGRTAIEGKTLLVYLPPAFAETIQFARYLTLLARRDAKVIVMATPAFARLIATVPGVASVVPFDQPPPAHDYHVALLSLPHLAGTGISNIPAANPYLFAAPAIAADWAARLGGAEGYKVGVAWIGGEGPALTRTKALDIAQLKPLADVPGVRLIALQQTETDQKPSHGIEMPGLLPDFAEAAGLIANLDLVVSVDAAVAHLAAAMGKPVWLLLPPVADWRWGIAGDRTPWYPSMRILRQRGKNSWDSLIKRVTHMLAVR